MRNSYLCPACKKHIEYSGNEGHAVICGVCGFEAPVISGVPVFVPVTSEQTEMTGKGFIEKLFLNACFYNAFVGFKNIIWSDNKIGIDEYIRGKDILDAGCGPSLDKPHLEYCTDDARTVTAVDISLPFAVNARKENPQEKFEFAVATIDNLPFPDKSFDTTIVSFVMHHLPQNLREVIAELKRVTRDHVIIFDHVLADGGITRNIQSAYLNFIDQGCNYLTEKEWEEYLSSLQVVKKIKTGAIFRHVIKFILAIN